MPKRKKIEAVVEEKIKREVDKAGTYDRKAKDGRMGAPPLEDRDLTNEQKKFAMLLARGIPVNMAQAQCGFSDYQKRNYLELPKMKKEIAKWKDVFSQEEVGKLMALWTDLQIDAIMLLKQRIGEGKISNQEIFKNIVNKNLNTGGGEEGQAVKKTMKITQTIKPKIKQIEHTSTDQIEGNVFDGMEEDEFETEETREMTIEENPEKDEDNDKE